MELYCGTSGYAYPEWRGALYPPGLGNDAMLACYAGLFRAVEINNTFYRMPRRAVVRQWAEQAPADFRLVIKASRRITHTARLRRTGEMQAFLLSSLEELGEKRGPVLFQLPPSMRKDLDRLRAFLDEWPSAVEASFELPHASWDDEEVRELLRERGVAWCGTDRAGGGLPELHPTAAYGALRLRAGDYGDEELDELLRLLRSTGWERGYVFFKQPRAALQLQSLAGLSREPPFSPPERWAESAQFREWLDDKTP